MKATSRWQNEELRALGFFLAVLICLCLGPARAPAQRAEDQLEHGIKLLASRQFTEALAAFTQFKLTSPLDPRPYFYSGIALTDVGRLTAAALELSEAVRLAPRQPEYLVFHAYVLAQLRQKTEAGQAVALVEKEGVAPPLETAWLWILSDVYYRLEMFQKALKVLDVLSARHPDDPRSDLNRGQVLLAMGELDLAQEAFRKSIRKSPATNATAYFELAKILHHRRELAPARQALLEAVRQAPENPEYLHQLGLVCLALGEIVEAITYLHRAEPAAPAYPKVYYALGSAYQRQGNRAKALEYKKKFQELELVRRKKEEQEGEVGKFLAQAERRLDEGRRSEAETLFARALEADPDNWDAHAYLAEMSAATGNWQQAYRHLVIMEKVDPDSVVGAYLMARYWHQQQRFDQARAYAEKVRLVRPGHAELRHLLGNIYLGLNQPEKARAEFEAAVRLAPERADFREDLRKIDNQKNR